MKILFRLSLLLVFSANASAQNLVPNFSFEDTVQCPDFVGQVTRASGWSSYGESPDYLNSCADPYATPSLSVPSNVFGWQQAYDGNAYMGLALWGNGGFREFLGAQLFDTLEPGTKYYLSAWISREYSAPYGVGACDNFCFRFSTIPWSVSHPAPIDNYASYRSTLLVTDTASWTHISGSFVADSAYLYLVIGNFFDDNNTNVVMPPGGNDAAYFVDYVCVTTDSVTCSISAGLANHESKTDAAIFPNPSPDGHFYLDKKEFISAGSVRVFDVLGQEIPVTILENPGKTEIVLPWRGVFFVEIKTSSGIVVRKIMW